METELQAERRQREELANRLLELDDIAERNAAELAQLSEERDSMSVSLEELRAERVDINELRVERDSLSSQLEEAERRHEDEVNRNRHKLTEILVNLMTNARQAMEKARVPDPTLIVTLAEADERIRISVRDNGVGISKENLSQVFNHGFTTKKGGHGFGLHSAANAAVEMKGRLSVESGGPGHGATFTLDLPLETAVATH